MNDITHILMIYGAIPSILGFGAFLVRSLLNRLTEVEREVADKIDEPRVREIMADKIIPLKEDINKLEIKLDRIIDLLMKK